MSDTHPPPLFQGRACLCVPADLGRYQICTRTTRRVLGAIRWYARRQVWVFLPAPGTAWDRGSLAGVGLWRRRLQRKRLARPSSREHRKICGRAYWIPGAYAPALSEKRNSFLRLWKNKGFKQKSMTQVGLDAISTATTLESNKSLRY